MNSARLQTVRSIYRINCMPTQEQWIIQNAIKKVILIYNNFKKHIILEIGFTKELRNLCSENYKILLHEIKDLIKRKVSCVHALQDLILLR